MPTAWFNGQMVDEDGAQVSLRDTGLLHAAGVFTTMRARDGRVFRLEHHLRRLRQSCDALFIPLQFSDADLASAVDQVLSENKLRDARLRATVTRGQAQQDPLHGMVLTPNCFVTASELQPYPASYYANGMTVVLEDEQKLNPYDVQAGHKTLNYLSRLTSMRQAAKRGAGEALWFNVHNYLQSGSISNVFLVAGGTLITPPTNDELRDPLIGKDAPYKRSNVLPGVTRQAVIEMALANQIPLRIQAITIDQLLAAQEVFLTNSIMQIMPVAAVEQHNFTPVPGPVTETIMQLFAEKN
ncbi:MAG: aminotransferase class IV [Phycisphaerae bacterium]